MIVKGTIFVFLIFHVYNVTCKTDTLILSEKLKTNAKNFYIINEKVNFFQAILNCEAEGMELANVLTADEEKDLIYLLKDVDKSGREYGGFWLSGTNLAQMNTSNYYWLSGGKRVLYTDWLPGQPNNWENNQHCLQYAELEGHVGWNDLNCQLNTRYICQDKTC